MRRRRYRRDSFQSVTAGKTQREAPAEADTVSHRLLLQSGMVHQLVAGVYSYLPLAWRVLKKIGQPKYEQYVNAAHIERLADDFNDLKDNS